jgi:hypothetical protein
MVDGFAALEDAAEMAFSYVLGQREPEGALPVLEALVESGQAFEGSTTHRAYLQLCSRQGRTPVKATPHKEPAPDLILDHLTVGEFREMMRGRGPERGPGVA